MRMCDTALFSKSEVRFVLAEIHDPEVLVFLYLENLTMLPFPFSVRRLRYSC